MPTCNVARLVTGVLLAAVLALLALASPTPALAGGHVPASPGVAASA